MGTGTDQVQLATLDLVDHEPVRFDMRLPIALPDSTQRMIAMTRGQGLPLDQRIPDGVNQGGKPSKVNQGCTIC